MKRLFLISLLAVLMTGCAGHQQSLSMSSDNSADNNDSGNAQIKIAEAATSVSDSLAQLAAIEKASTKQVKLPPPPNPASIHMAQNASVDWNGPLEPLLKQIAQASNYKLRVLGNRPAIPVVVSVNASNEPLASILRDASFQAVKKANVLVYPSQRVIELRYRNA